MKREAIGGGHKDKDGRIWGWVDWGKLEAMEVLNINNFIQPCKDFNIEDFASVEGVSLGELRRNFVDILLNVFSPSISHILFEASSSMFVISPISYLYDTYIRVYSKTGYPNLIPPPLLSLSYVS